MVKSNYLNILAELQETVIEMILLVLTVFVVLVCFKMKMLEAAAFCLVLLIFYIPGLIFYYKHKEKEFIEKHLISFVTGLCLVGVFMYLLAAVLAYL